MTLIAMPVINPSARGLLRVQSKFRIRFAELCVAGTEEEKQSGRTANKSSYWLPWSPLVRQVHSCLVDGCFFSPLRTYNNRAIPMAIVVKRIYDEVSPADGARVLVDRLWPRGISKKQAALDAWLKELAPSDELRRWSHAHREAWTMFRKRYLRELTRPSAHEQLQELYRLARGRKRLTLLYAFKDEEHNNAVVLKDLLDGMKKPPTGTGPAAAMGATRLRKAARRPA